MRPRLKWRLTSAAGLQWRIWGDQAVVFNPASGDTHLVDLVARAGLRCLEAGPATGDDICRQMAEQLAVPYDEALLDYVSRLLAQLRELGLVEAAQE